MSEVQGANEGTQGTYLPQAAEVDVPAVRQNQDAKAKVEIGSAAISPKHGGADEPGNMVHYLFVRVA